jgi:hypothetical protein
MPNSKKRRSFFVKPENINPTIVSGIITPSKLKEFYKVSGVGSPAATQGECIIIIATFMSFMPI